MLGRNLQPSVQACPPIKMKDLGIVPGFHYETGMLHPTDSTPFVCLGDKEWRQLGESRGLKGSGSLRGVREPGVLEEPLLKGSRAGRARDTKKAKRAERGSKLETQWHCVK